MKLCSPSHAARWQDGRKAAKVGKPWRLYLLIIPSVSTTLSLESEAELYAAVGLCWLWGFAAWHFPIEQNGPQRRQHRADKQPAFHKPDPYHDALG